MPTAVDAALANRAAALGVQVVVANAVAKDHGLGLTATYFPDADHIRVWGSVVDLRLGERSVELMCALPASAPNVLWGVDITEKVDPFAQQPGVPTPERASGPYTLWLDAFDFDEEMGWVSVAGPDGKERVVAVLAPAGTQEQVNQKWHTFVVEGIRESDFVGDTLRVRICNFVGGCTMVDIGGIYLMDARKGTVSDEDANVLTAKSEGEVIRRAVGSWVAAPKYRPKKGVRQWFFQRKSLAIRDGCWVEIAIHRGERRSGSADITAGEAPPQLNEEGKLLGMGYPWATVTQRGKGGYTLAVSPDMPCLYRFQFDAAAEELQLVLSYGLSALPRREALRSQAPFRLALYRTDDEWGFREAAQRYYALSPKLFQRPTDRFGFWYGAGPHRDYGQLDGLYAYLEVHEARLYPRRFIKGRADWDLWKENLAAYYPRHADLGILVLPYRHFYHCSLHVKGDMDGTLPHMPKTYDEAMTMLRALPLPFGNGYAHHIREVIDSSSMQRRDGRMDVKLSADDPCAPTGRLIFRTSISPYLYEDRPDVITNARTEMEFARELLDAFPQVGGIYYDAGAAGGGVDYHPEHLRYAHSPLAPGPGISRMAGKYEFGRWMGEFLHRNGKIHFVNGGAGMSPAQVWHILPFDAIGVEWPPVAGGERTLRFLRTIAGRKPVSFLKIQAAGDVRAAYETYVGKLGVYGVFPPPGVMLMGTRRHAGCPDEWVAPYACALQAMYLAGWQPVTHARSDRADLLVERYGPRDGKVFFPVFNPTRSAARTHLVVDAQALAMPGLSKAVALFATQPNVRVEPAGKGNCRVAVHVPARRLVVVQMAEKEVDDAQTVVDHYPAKHRAWLAQANEPRLVGEWRFEEGEGQTVSDSSGTDAHAVLGTAGKPEDSDPVWVAEGHSGRALKFDGQDDAVTLRRVAKLRLRHAFTIEAWIKRSRRTRHARVIDLGGTCVYFGSTGDKVGLRIGGYGVNTAWSTPIPLNRWTRVTASYDGKTIRMCVDGKLCGTREFPCDRPLSGAAMTIGNAAAISRPFAGLIDEVRVWNYAR